MLRPTPLHTLARPAACLIALACAAAPALADRGHSASTAAASTATTVTNASGTISQLNYNDAGYVDGLVLGTSTLLRFPGRVCNGVSTLGAVGQSVTYSGSATTNAATGLQAVRVSSLTNASTAASYTAPVAPTSSAYAATAGTLTRLNFDGAASINGFLFTPTGSSTPVLVAFGGAVRSTTLTPLLTVGAAVTVSGTTTEGETPCGTTSAVSTVRATTLVVGGSSFSFGSGRR